MSDRDLRRILNEVIEDIDQGRLRPVPPARVRTRLGGAVLAAALGLGVAACDGRVVGTVHDGGPPDVMLTDRPDAAPDPDPGPDAAPDPAPDAGVVVGLDGGFVGMYFAMGFPDSGIVAIDAGEPDPDAEVDIEAPAYMAPFPDDE